MSSNILCPQCKTELRARPEKIGQGIRCWSCRAEVLIPGPPASHVPDLTQFSEWARSLTDSLPFLKDALDEAALVGKAWTAEAMFGLIVIIMAILGATRDSEQGCPSFSEEGRGSASAQAGDRAAA